MYIVGTQLILVEECLRPEPPLVVSAEQSLGKRHLLAQPVSGVHFLPPLLGALDQRAANVFCKGPDSKYFRFCRSVF